MTGVARRVLVRGEVQGVAFRFHARKVASDLGVAGWVRNLPDGAVETWIEGAPAVVAAMIDWLRRGPPAAHVAGLEVEEKDFQGHPSFEIRRGS